MANDSLYHAAQLSQLAHGVNRTWNWPTATELTYRNFESGILKGLELWTCINNLSLPGALLQTLQCILGQAYVQACSQLAPRLVL